MKTGNFRSWPVERVELAEFVERQRAFDQEGLIIGDAERAGHEAAQFGRHRRVDFEPDRGSAAAALERTLEHTDEILRFFLDFDVAVAEDAERPLAAHGIAGKQTPDEQADRGLKGDETRRRLLASIRQTDEALDLRRHADQRIHAAAVGVARKLQREREAEIRNERKGVCRIDRKRRQHREDLVEEMILEPSALVTRKLGAVNQRDATFGQ